MRAVAPMHDGLASCTGSAFFTKVTGNNRDENEGEGVVKLSIIETAFIVGQIQVSWHLLGSDRPRCDA